MSSLKHKNDYSTGIPGQSTNGWKNPLLWVTLIVYISLAGYTMANHEMWGDELHSWNIAKGSAGFFDLISNSKYEGHPPLWYILLWSISKFTHDMAFVQAVQFIIASLSIFLILFYSPLPLITKILSPFGYFFLFEYAVISRNYAAGVLLAIGICLIMRKHFRYKTIVYYSLLFLMTNVHLQALLLAASLHLYFLLYTYELEKSKKQIIYHILSGLLIALPAIYFILPAADSQVNAQPWSGRLDLHRVTAFSQGIVRAFLPVPAWWNEHFWNTQFLLEAKERYGLLRYIIPVTALTLTVLTIFILKGNKKSLILFVTNLALTFIIAITILTMGSARYTGFMYIGFIVSYCLYCFETPVKSRIKWIVNGLLIIQLIAGVFSIVKDIRYPFSDFYKVNELLVQVPATEKTVADYWALNAVVAYTDKPFYCIDLQKEISFVLWNRELGDALKRESRYGERINEFFKKENITKVYLLSAYSQETLFRIDAQLKSKYDITLIDKREGALEKGGNLYLYKVSGHVQSHFKKGDAVIEY